jgi:hypothetical protein
MSMLHEDWKRPSGIHVMVPSDDTTTFVGNLLSICSLALHPQYHTQAQIWK